jgi:hypothetical protein
MFRPVNTTQELRQVVSCNAGAVEVQEESVITSKAEGLYETAQQ